MDESVNKSSDANKNIDNGSADSSLSLSFTPPCLDDTLKDEKQVEKGNAEQSDSSISEHLTSERSVENDRSFQEIEISNLLSPTFSFGNLPEIDGVEPISQEMKPSLNNSSSSNNMLDEILSNEQFKCDSVNSESFNIFVNAKLDDETIFNREIADESDKKAAYYPKTGDVAKQVKELEDLVALKDDTIAALASELESYRDMTSNPSTMSSTTEYKQLQEDFQQKVSEYQNAIEEKDNLIMELTESLQQSIACREDLKSQAERFQNELIALQEQLDETRDIVRRNRQKSDLTDSVDTEDKNINSTLNALGFEEQCSALEETMSLLQNDMFVSLKDTIHRYIEKKIQDRKLECDQNVLKLQEEIAAERELYSKEVGKLTELIAKLKSESPNVEELELQHLKQMEDLRLYYEQKCADIEKNYSEEIFSQQSRKLSSSDVSEDISGDILFNAHQPGPGGDATASLDMNRVDLKNRNLNFISENQLKTLKNNVVNICKIFDEHDLENISENDVELLKDRLAKCDVKDLFKFELSSVKNEMQNKYYAELEILREDYENRVDSLQIKHEEKLKSVEEKYLEEIENLRDILNDANKSVMYSTAVQEVGSSGDFEINEVILSYERRLQEQVAQARYDIVSTLEYQIQKLASNNYEDQEWPSELLSLRDKFAKKYEDEIADLKEHHEEEINRLKEEHIKNLSSALERARRRSLREGDSLPEIDNKLMEERNNYKRQSILLRQLIGELMRHFTKCEDEINNTIIDELVKQSLNRTDFEKELDKDISNGTDSDSIVNVKRVHLTPNYTEIINMIENCSCDSTETEDVTSDLKNELGSCLEKLKSDAQAILTLSVSLQKSNESLEKNGELVREDSLEERFDSLRKKYVLEKQSRIELEDQVQESKTIIESLEQDRVDLDFQINELIDRLNIKQGELEAARLKITELVESGQREIISEGYGEDGFVRSQERGQAMSHFNELQGKVRAHLTESPVKDTNLLDLIEELCRTGERILEDWKQDKKDLFQQIEAADKKYKKTCLFLEEQAADREQERDDAQKLINHLNDQLRDKDKSRVSYERMNDEVKQLEKQLQEALSLISEQESQLKDSEKERDEAVDRIEFLRDVIRKLETELLAKAGSEVDLRNTIRELESFISKQNEPNAESVDADAHSNKIVSDKQKLNQYIGDLENEVQRLRLSQELVGAEGIVKEFQNQLIDFEKALDKKTKRLEELHSETSTNNSCSSPSEDMSIRDVVRSSTQDAALNDCEVPLQQLARLKEKLIKHSRAEDAAIKRIRDLEMQIFNLKNSIDEHQLEKDILKKEIADNVILISSLQIRLDEQRIRAEHIDKQANSSLECKIYDLQKEISELRDQLQNRDKNITELKRVVEETKQKLHDKEQELDSSTDDEIIVEMQKELEHLRSQNEILKSKLSSGAEIIPNLVENIISDKNSDIESLRQKLRGLEKQLEVYNSLSLDKGQIQVLTDLKNSGTSLTEVLSILDLSRPDVMRKYDSQQDSLSLTQDISRNLTKTNTPSRSNDNYSEISDIEKLGASNDHYISMTPLRKRNSTEIKSCERRVHFEDEEIEILRREVMEKDQIIKDCNAKIESFIKLEETVDGLQAKLEETEKILNEVSSKYEMESLNFNKIETDLKVDIMEKKIKIEDLRQEIDDFKSSVRDKENLIFELSNELKNVKKHRQELEEKMKETEDAKKIIAEKDAFIKSLQKELSEVEDTIKLRNELKEKRKEITELYKDMDVKNERIQFLEDQIKNTTKDLEDTRKRNSKLMKQLENFESQTKTLNEKICELIEKISTEETNVKKLELVIKEKDDILMDKGCELDIVKEDLKHFEDTVAKMEDQLKDYENIKNRMRKVNGELVKKNSELIDLGHKYDSLTLQNNQLDELMKEKDKVIQQFNEDSKSLHANLETIKNKMRENGNIIELGQKLRDEQMKNADLTQEIHLLKAQMLEQAVSDPKMMVTSIDDITGKVRKELDYAAHLDSSIIDVVENITDCENFYGDRLDYSQLLKKVNDLELLLNKERLTLNEVQLEDARLIEQLRIQLENTQACETELEQLLQTERNSRKLLQTEVVALKEKLNALSSKSESTTEYKSLPTQVPADIAMLRNDLAVAMDELQTVKNENKALKKSKTEAEISAKYTKDMVDLKNKEMKRLERRLENGNKTEALLREKIVTCSAELEQKCREVENSRVLIEEIDLERNEIKKQYNELNQKLQAKEQVFISPVGFDVNMPIPDELMKKIEELNEAVKDNKKTVDLVVKLSNEKKYLEEKLADIENYMMNINNIENPTSRANYLFAKYLRIESYRKALVWQKRYLISLLETYQRSFEPNRLGNPQNSDMRQRTRSHLTPIQKFRSVVNVVVSIYRMQFLVKRWHSGKRIAQEVYSKYSRSTTKMSNYQSPTTISEVPTTHFRIGHPVSHRPINVPFNSALHNSSPNVGDRNRSENVFGNVAGSRVSNMAMERNLPNSDLPWFGASPPSRDRTRIRPSLINNPDNLSTPALISKYVERCNQIQEHLGLILKPSPST